MNRFAARKRRVFWTVTDQALSSISNFGLGLVVARTVDARGFGTFAIAYTVYTLAQGVSRAACTDPLLVRHSTVGSGQRGALAGSIGAAGLLGIAVAVPIAWISLVSQGGIGDALLGLAIGLPGLFVQDAVRFTFFAIGQPARAALNDLIWILAQAAFFAALCVATQPSAAVLLAAWGTAATLAAAIGAAQLRAFPNPFLAVSWWRENRDLASRFVGDSFAMVGSQQLTTYVVAATSGLAAAGSLRAAMILLGPVGVIFQGAQSAAITEGSRLRQKEPVTVRRMSRRLALALPIIGACWVAALLMLPEGTGRLLLGASWAGAREVLPYLGIASCLAGLVFAANSGLRAMSEAGRALRARLIAFPIKAIGGAGGGAVGGAVGAAVGIMLSDLVTSAIWWHQLERGMSTATSPHSMPVAPARAIENIAVDNVGNE